MTPTRSGSKGGTLPNGAEFRLPLWQMMLHVANHGTQHRSEVAALLTGFGQSPGDLDLLVYLWDRSAPSPSTTALE
ncbi:MAG TPA: DinB family protein [Chloroflexota bacterium]|nr:DinB family protein [Chloroflexota bacterium]